MAKLDARQVEPVLRDPGALRVVLLHGEDGGLIAERARRLVRAVAGTLDDPFRVSELERDGLKRIPEEMATSSLTGGRRVVRVRDVGDAATGPVEEALRGRGTALLVLEAPSLPSRSKLRQALERAPEAAVIGCYPLEGEALGRDLRAGLQARGIAAEEEAIAWLAQRLGSDRAGTQAELDKLALAVAPGEALDLAAVQAAAGDLADLSLEDALFAATSGDAAAMDRALESALAEGMAPVGVIRAALGHAQRLVQAQLATAAGMAPLAAAKAARPPVFFRRERAFVRALETWPPPRLRAAAAMLFRAEHACKRTGAPAEAIARSALQRLTLRSLDAPFP